MPRFLELATIATLAAIRRMWSAHELVGKSALELD